MARGSEKREGQTNLGSLKAQGVAHVQSRGNANEPSILALDATDGTTVTTYYLWVDQNGDLRIGSTFPTDEDADGTVVGTQT